MQQRMPWWKWSSAAAALIVTSAGAWQTSRPPKPPTIVSIDVKVTGVVSETPPRVNRKSRKRKTPAVIPAHQ
jgi:hypothetical protein